MIRTGFGDSFSCLHRGRLWKTLANFKWKHPRPKDLPACLVGLRLKPMERLQALNKFLQRPASMQGLCVSWREAISASDGLA